jgi:hypothetical protein
MSTGGEKVEARVGREEGSAVGDGTECALFIALPFGSGFEKTVTSLCGERQEIGSIVVSFESVSTLDLFSRYCSDGCRAEAGESAGRVSIKVAGAAGGRGDGGEGDGRLLSAERRH